MLGLPNDEVIVSSYTDDWPLIYQTEVKRIQKAIGMYILDIQHIGSTSVPGLCAKPIIDIAIAVESFEGATVCIAPLEKIGYRYRGENGMPRRHYFVKGDPRTHHIHMLEENSENWARHIRFRNRLRSNPLLIQEYGALKLALASNYHRNRYSYQKGKSEFIARVENMREDKQPA